MEIVIFKVIILGSLLGDFVIFVIMSLYLHRILHALNKMNNDARKVVFMNVFNRGKSVFKLYGIGAFIFAIAQIIALMFSRDYFMYSAISVSSVMIGGPFFIVGTRMLGRIVESGK